MCSLQCFVIKYAVKLMQEGASLTRIVPKLTRLGVIPLIETVLLMHRKQTRGGVQSYRLYSRGKADGCLNTFAQPQSISSSAAWAHAGKYSTMVQTVLETGDVGPSHYFDTDTSLLCLVKGKACEALSCGASYISVRRHPYSVQACKVRRVLPCSKAV